MEKESYWKEYGKELELEKEIQEMGVEKVESGEVKLPERMAKQMGIKPTVVAGTQFSGVSLTDAQLTTGKAKPVTKSIRWLVEWFIYELLKAHFIIKFIKGKIFRTKDDHPIR